MSLLFKSEFKDNFFLFDISEHEQRRENGNLTLFTVNEN